MSVSTYVIGDDNCRYPSMTREQILTAIQQAVEQGEITDVDTGFVTRIKNVNGGYIRFWVGSNAEYNKQVETLPPNTFCLITDDTLAEDLLTKMQDIENSIDSVENLVVEVSSKKDIPYFTTNENQYNYFVINTEKTVTELKNQLIFCIPTYTNTRGSLSFGTIAEQTWHPIKCFNNGELTTILPTGAIVAGCAALFYIDDSLNAILINRADIEAKDVWHTAQTLFPSNDISIAYKKSGDIVSVRFVCENTGEITTSDRFKIYQLPTGYRPTYITGSTIGIFVSSPSYNEDSVKFEIMQDGTIYLCGNQSIDKIDLVTLSLQFTI